jgi:hypothetical protein
MTRGYSPQRRLAARSPGTAAAIGALIRYETRRAGWPALAAAPAVIAAGVLITLILAGKGSDPQVFAQFWLREILPLPFGLAIAALPAAETCLETQLSVPTPITWTLGRRAGLCLLWSVLAAAAAAAGAYGAGLWHPAHGVLAGQLTWLAPALALAAIGAAVFAASGSVTGASAVVACVWLVQDLTVQWFAGHAWTRTFYLFVDDRPGAMSGWWWPNRLTLLAVGVLLTGFAGVLLTTRLDQVFAARLRHQGGDA